MKRREQQSNNITHFALKELVVGSDELLFLRRFGNIFDTSQQFVLVQELEKENVIRQERKHDTSRCDVASCPEAFLAIVGQNNTKPRRVNVSCQLK